MKSFKQVFFLLALVSSFAIVLAGCGGGGSSSTSTPTTTGTVTGTVSLPANTNAKLFDVKMPLYARLFTTPAYAAAITDLTKLTVKVGSATTNPSASGVYSLIVDAGTNLDLTVTTPSGNIVLEAIIPSVTAGAAASQNVDSTSTAVALIYKQNPSLTISQIASSSAVTNVKTAIETALTDSTTDSIVSNSTVTSAATTAATTVASTTVPSAPTGVTATAGSGQVAISWSSVTGATSYNLYMASQSGVTKSNYSSLTGGMAHTGVTSPYAHTSLTNGTAYYFVVTAVNSAGESSESSEVSATPTATVNQLPTATLSADKTSGTAPLAVTFTIGYTDPEGAAGTYSLDYGDSTTAATGSINSGASTTVQHTYSSAGTYTATVTVTDDKGATGTANVAVSVTSPTSITYSYSYFKRYGTTTPETATLTNGTLGIDGKTMSGVYLVEGYGGSTCLAGTGTGSFLTACLSPADTPHTMLLCGPDPVTAAPDTLLYVLFDSPDTNRVSATATSFLNALQSETGYLGTGVYTDCSGSTHTAWIRNYPQTNYYLWPDVFTTYSSTYVSGLLSGAVIYSTPTAGNNYKQYVAVRVVGTTVFEVWH